MKYPFNSSLGHRRPLYVSMQNLVSEKYMAPRSRQTNTTLTPYHPITPEEDTMSPPCGVDRPKSLP